jgi:urease gamma subunit
MAFADPQSVTINSIAISLPRVGSGVGTGQFKANDGLVTLSVSHANGKRNRRTMRLEHHKTAADPFTGNNVDYSMTFYVVADVPKYGYTVAEQKQVVDGFLAFLTASTGAKITQLLGGEN